MSNQSQAETGRRMLGLSLPVVMGLSLLAAPRVVLHDLDVIHEGTFVNFLFAGIPMLVWVGVVVLKRVHNPFLTLVAVGVCYGVILALVHQLFWGASFADGEPSLGGNLSGLDPAVQAIIIRGFAALSSLVTGTLVGAACGAVAWVLSALTKVVGRSRA